MSPTFLISIKVRGDCMTDLEQLILSAKNRTREAEKDRLIDLLKKENKSLKGKVTKLEKRVKE